MKTGIFICARLGSTRLTRKHLIEADGVPFILHLVRRVNREFLSERQAGTVVVALISSDEPENREFINVLNGEAEVFFGSIDNIPLRQAQAARHFGAGAIIAVDGDDPLVSVRGLRALYARLAAGGIYAKTDGLPLGMNGSGYNLELLEKALSGRQGDQLDTGWGHIFKGVVPEIVGFDVPCADERLRFTLDYEPDARFFLAIAAKLGARFDEATDSEIVDLVWRDRLFELNAGLAEEYWANFRRETNRQIPETD
jgi:spore coat polysaccharide biosynthesis protein SpsF (cytidylyltransferase family)